MAERQKAVSGSDSIEKIWMSRRGHKGKNLRIGSAGHGDGNANALAQAPKESAPGPASNQFVPGNSLYDWAPASKLGYRRPSSLYRVDSRDSHVAHYAATEQRQHHRRRPQARSRSRSAGRVLPGGDRQSRPVTPINDIVFSQYFGAGDGKNDYEAPVTMQGSNLSRGSSFPRRSM